MSAQTSVFKFVRCFVSLSFLLKTGERKNRHIKFERNFTKQKWAPSWARLWARLWATPRAFNHHLGPWEYNAGAGGRADRHADDFKKLRGVPWRGVLLYVARATKYVDDVVDGGDLVKRMDVEALEVAVNFANSAYSAAVAALKEYKYTLWSPPPVF